jgi:hypothetical protein
MIWSYPEYLARQDRKVTTYCNERHNNVFLCVSASLREINKMSDIALSPEVGTIPLLAMAFWIHQAWRY